MDKPDVEERLDRLEAIVCYLGMAIGEANPLMAGLSLSQLTHLRDILKSMEEENA